MGKIWREIRGFVLWTYERGSLRYDIMVGLILAFIFFTPRGFFRDQPLPNVEKLQPGVYRVDVQALVPSSPDLDHEIVTLLQQEAKRDVHIQRIEPMRDAGGTLLAYKVWTNP